MTELATKLIGEITASIDAQYTVGPTPHGMRTILTVKDGRFNGPDLHAELLPGSADWFLVRADGAGELNVRMTLRAGNGDLIYVVYRGILLFTPEILERWSRGEAIPPEETYFRVTPYFETASEKYAWLNQIVSVGTGQLISGGVCYQVYQVL